MKTKKQIIFKLLSVLLLTLLTFNFASAQTIPKLQDPTNQFIINKAIDIDANGGIIYYKKDSLLVGQLFTTYFSSTGLGPFDSMALVNTTFDSILVDEDSPAPNLAHNTYQQYYKGLEVENASYMEHYCNNIVWLSSGVLTENLNMSVVPNYNETEALNLAKTYSNVSTTVRDSLGFTIIGKLLITKQTNSDTTLPDNNLLAWKFTIIADTNNYNSNVYVNAMTGSIIKEESNIRNDNFDHLYYSNKNDLDCHKIKAFWWWDDDDYYLFADDPGRNIYTNNDYGKDYKNKTWPIGEMPRNNNPNWGNYFQRATSAHYCAQKAWDYFKTTPLNRNGISGWGNHLRISASDNDPGNINIYEHDGSQDYIRIGYSGGYLTTYDLVGHEFAHGVIYRSKPLPKSLISGAIAESFGDIFGFMTERHAFGYTRNWTIGEDVYIMRNLQFPNSGPAGGDPSYFKQDGFWLNYTTPIIVNPNESNDYGGIHNNSGVMNKWFYLLSSGGSQEIKINNIIQPTRSVMGIGIDKAARIAYYAMTNFDNFGGNKLSFSTVKANTIAAAKILYGSCSNEYLQTCKAWYAVNVGFDCQPCTPIISWDERCNVNNNGFTQLKNLTTLTNVKVILFPNPVKNVINLIIEEPNAIDNLYQINISTIEGKLMKSYTINQQGLLPIDISNLNNGIYFINIVGNKWNKTLKFVKE
jgi:Zn-dependent metalloprotease